ncbi:MAG: hypothetical protein Kow0092_20450 [Deferrisomatales bacterium]
MAIDRDKIARNALRFIQKGQFHKAIDEYKKVLSLDPRDIRTRLKLIDLYGRAGRKQEAIDECLQVADSYADQGFYLKAIAVYKQALRISPETPALYRNMGEMYVKQGLLGDALAAFKRGVELLRRLGRPREAQDLLARMEEMAPENAAIKIHLAELYLEDGRLEAFEAELAKVILQLRGEGRSRKLLKAVEAFYEKSNHHPSVRKRLAELYVELGEEERALEVVREGLAAEPADRDLRLLALRAHLALGQLPEARRMALGLQEEDPDDLFILEQLAAIAQARGDREELAQAYKAMAKVYGRRGLSQKEEQCFQKVLQLFPEDAEARLALGEVIVEPALEEPEPAPPVETPEWDEAGPAGPAGVESVHEGLMEAELYLKYGIEEKAEEKLRALVQLAPDNLDVHQRLRDLCQRRGDREGWVAEQLRIAELFLRDKRENEALRAYQAVLEVDPGNADARNGVQFLRPDVLPERTEEIEIDLDGGTIEFVEEDGEERVVRRREAEARADEADDALRQGLAEADFYEAQGRTEEAVRALLEVRERHPGSPHVAARLARLGWQGDAEEAPREESFVDLQAEVLDGSGFQIEGGFEGFDDFEASELDDIVREFKSGIAEKLDEGDYETHYNLGVAYREMGLLEDALQEFQVAARSPEKARDAYTSLADVFREMGRPDDAHAALRMALAAPENRPEDRAAILYEIAALAEERGDREQALELLRKVAETDPTHRDVAGRIRTLEARGRG